MHSQRDAEDGRDACRTLAVLCGSSSAESLAQAIPAAAEQIAAAREVGVDVVIPVADLAVAEARVPELKALNDHVKNSPEGLSRADSRAIMESGEDQRVEDYVADTLAAMEQQNAEDASRETVVNDLTERISAALPGSRDANRKRASIIAAYFARRAQTLGTTAEELYRENLPVFRFGEIPDRSMLQRGLEMVGLRQRPVPENVDSLFQSAYHGSPHRFDKFSLDNIGSGEGAQAYGWGLYFAGDKEVAEYYRKKLSDYEVRVDGGSFNEENAAHRVAKRMHETGFSREQMLDTTRIRVSNLLLYDNGGKNGLRHATEELSFLESSGDIPVVTGDYKGQLYEADIPKNDVLLDWDKPFSEQPENVRKAVESSLLAWGESHADARFQAYANSRGITLSQAINAFEYSHREKTAMKHGLGSGTPGYKAYNFLTLLLGDEKSASEYLNSLGIKGVRYLDGNSRDKGEGSYNYVIFDDSAIEVLDRFYQRSQEQGTELEQELQKEFADTEKAYGGQPAYEKVKEAGRTKLDYRQWVHVRTPRFKQWFGDWEAARGVQQLDGMPPANLDGLAQVEGKKGVEEVFRGFGEVENKADGRSVVFPVGMAGKIVRHKGFDVTRIAGAFDRLFAESVPMVSELEVQREGHKDHSAGTDAYHHYAGRFELDGKRYYIRFTTQRQHAKKGEGSSVSHSAFVSDVTLYETRGISPARVRVIDPGVTVTDTPVDRKLAQWLSDGNPDNVSKVVDTVTGEPMVVYHGTSERGLTVFDLTQARQNADIPSFFFTTEREEAEGYGGNVIEAFLNIRNPTEKPNANMRGSEVRQRLEAEGFDGTITEDGYSTEYAAFSPTQIKSATGNTGEYGADNPNIFHQRSAATRFAFEKRIDELYAGAKPNKEGVRALDEGDVLTITGYGNMPVVINERHAVDDGQYNHGLTAEDWKKVPEWLDNPVAVFERARDGHLTLIAPEKKNGRAIVMALEPAVAAPEGYTGEARRHIVLTVYPKDSGVLSLRSEIERGEVVPVYADQKKNSPGFFDGSGVRYPGSVTELRTANRNIKTDADLVKYRRSRDAQGFGQKGKNLGSFQPSTQTFTFSKDANLSTFLHETGHFFLEMESRIANRLVAKAESGETLTAEEQRMLSDNRVLLDWFGVQDLNAWNAMTVEEQTSHHERFAQAFEKYLFEGKAPSVELQGTFQRFMAWLLDVYKSWSNISSEPLSDVVRGVFDRMLATDEQIEMARASREIKPMFESAEQTGVSPEVWERYQADNEALIEAAKETQRSRGLRDMKWLHNKVSAEVTRLQREAKALRRELHAEVTVDVMNRPVYQAWAFLTRKMTDSDRIAAPEKGTGESVDPSRDSMFTAIAKLGGLNRAQAQAEWGIDKREKIENPAFGKPVLRAKEGRSIDEMARALAELGYLPTDENGKVDVHDFEQAFHNELIGSPQYSTALDPASLMESRAGEQIVNPAALGAGRLDMGSLREMYGDAGQYATRRTAANFKDAKDAALSFVNKPLTNRKSGMVATVSGNSIGKMLNTKAVGKSSSPETHARVVANLDVLFERAVLGWSRPDKNSDINIPAIHRFFTAVHTETGVHLVKLTVKEHLSGEQGNKIYSVEAVEINEESPAVKWVNSYAEADSLGTSSIRPSGDVLNLAQQIQNVNRSDSALIVALLKARHMTAETGGVHPDLLAEVMPWGYDSGDALIRELVVAEPPRDVIEAETDARMLEEHGELATPEAIEQSANEALTNSALIRMTATEFVALDNALGKGVLNREEFLARQRMVMAAARGFADALINRSSVRDIVPSRFYAAARKARAESEKAFRNGDIQAAAEAKRREIFQNQIKTHETRSGLI